jgi:hypothetical protein
MRWLAGVSLAAAGFCLDQVPAGLTGTGFTAKSALATKADCEAAGHEWCPLLNQIKEWVDGDGNTIEYYWYSGCCTGKQGSNLIPDLVNELPTCKAGTVATSCTRDKWARKLKGDLLDDDYDFQVAPSTLAMDHTTYGGFPGEVGCVCAKEDPRCEKCDSPDGDCTHEDATKCLVCLTDEPCSNDKVEISISFFKIRTIDLKTSELVASAWVREIWTDGRLSFDYQCYGGLEFIELQAEAGDLENSLIWTPDFELYNNEEGIWRGLGARLAMVYSCWDGAPSRGGCGWIFWSRPGLIKALCRYTGLVKFPYDALTCQLEMAGWGVDGRFQDIVPRASDGGVNWIDNPDSTSVAGLEAGSAYQDYRIADVSVSRKVVFYDCCPNSPFPELLFKIEFARSVEYYSTRLVLPAILLTCVSFITFMMDPETGERLGFGITLILAMFANDFTASAMMPVCREKVMMDYLSMVSMLFGCLSLVETGLVLHVYHQSAEDWNTALVPSWAQYFQWLAKQARIHALRQQAAEDHTAEKVKPKRKSIKDATKESRDVRMRKQLYRQIFFVVDADFGGTLDIHEIAEFGQFMLGMEWDELEAVKFMDTFDLNSDGVLDFEEFSVFCELHICPKVVDESDPAGLGYIKSMVDAFIQVVHRKEEARLQMWHSRAEMVDSFARWTIPPGYAIFVLAIFSLPEATLDSINTGLIDGSKMYILVYLMGFVTVVFGAVVRMGMYAKHVREKKQRRKELMERRSKAAEEAEADVVAATDVIGLRSAPGAAGVMSSTTPLVEAAQYDPVPTSADPANEPDARNRDSAMYRSPRGIASEETLVF